MPLRHKLNRSTVQILAGLIFSATPLAAQKTLTADGPGRAVTVNPFFLLAGWISGEYEQRVNSSLTVGGGVSYFKYDDTRYTNFEVKGSLYPNEHAMRGFSVSGSLGITQLSYVDNSHICDLGCPAIRRGATSPALGIGLTYQWMLGRTGRTAIAVGIGGKRFLASKSTLGSTDVVIPTSRLGIGYAF
jgi:hypothetical protein